MNDVIKVFLYISDLLSPPLPCAKLFEELILDFGVSHKDRGKYNFLMKSIPSPWLQGQKTQGFSVLLKISFPFLRFPSMLILFSWRSLSQINVSIIGRTWLMTLKTWTGKKFICATLSVVGY